MGKAVIKAADSAGLQILPVSFGSPDESGQTIQVCGKDIKIHGPSEREGVLASVFDEHPDLIVVDYTVPAAVNGKSRVIYYLKKQKRNLNCSFCWDIEFYNKKKKRIDLIALFYKMRVSTIIG